MLGHPLELAVVFIIGLLVFGPKKLPEITRNVGRGINAFRKGLDGFTMQGESVDEAEMLQRRRDLADLELQILEKKEELARQEMANSAPFNPDSFEDVSTAEDVTTAEEVTTGYDTNDEPVSYGIDEEFVDASQSYDDDAESETVHVNREDIKHVLEKAQAEQNLTQNA